MKTFRQKYVYNPQNPIYSSQNILTYNCMNTQTKNKRLILLHHLSPPPFIQPHQNTLQPIQIPTLSQPFSVYPLVRCCSQIQKINQSDAMYIIKCIAQSKLPDRYLYAVICQQGICVTEVQGILPNRTPPLYQLAKDILGTQGQGLSQDGQAIMNSLKNKQNNLVSKLQVYGWKDKKQKQNISDSDFIIFKGRRKQQGPFNEQYGLAWNNDSGLVKFNHISLVKDGYQEHNYKEYMGLLSYIGAKSEQNQLFMKSIRFIKQSKSIKIFTELSNQGTLSEYINMRNDNNDPINQRNLLEMYSKFVQKMAQFSKDYKMLGIGTLHIKNIQVHQNTIKIGMPLFITDTIQKKLRDTKNNMDYYSPEMKSDIILYQNFQKHNKQKMDIWCFGFVLYKSITRQIPVFDQNKKPILNKQKVSPAMRQLITKCLDLNPQIRPNWSQINLKQIQKKSLIVQQFVGQDEVHRSQIKLGSRTQRRSQKPKSPQKKQRAMQQLQIENQKNKIKIQQVPQQQQNLKQLQPEVSQLKIPQQISSKLKKIKLISKIIIISLMYIFIFFRPFIFSSIAIIQVRSNYSSTSLHLVDSSNSRVSSSTILTSDPSFFMNNDISFDDVYKKYHCLDDNFDPVNNPKYSLLSYVQSGSFLALLLTGWLAAIAIIVTKAISIYKGGISNRPQSNSKQLPKYILTYTFHQICLASLLFAHFFAFQFFYFSGAWPCFSIASFSGLEPIFDSSLYLFLNNTSGYFSKVFSTLGVLWIILLLGNCFYAWSPKLDQKYFCNCISILFKIVPLLLLVLLCRVGVFMLFSPTAINDNTQIIPLLLQKSFNGFIGIIPQVFVVVCVSVQFIIELFMSWCQEKTAKSDRLIKFFSIKRKKLTITNLTDKQRMSVLQVSQQKLGSQVQQY